MGNAQLLVRARHTALTDRNPFKTATRIPYLSQVDYPPTRVELSRG